MTTDSDPRNDNDVTRPERPTTHEGNGSRTSPVEIGAIYAERYRIVDLLGGGGMGKVYRAHDTKLDVDVALKRVHYSTAATLAQVAQEVRLARQITHRAICRVFDVGETNGEPYITMEYVDGEDLGSLLRRIGRLPSAKVIDVARQACAGLAAAHAHGILHRDLKPANIMMDRRGDVRITDFGIASVQDETSEGGGYGTPAYMAPEQLQGQRASPQSDLYALSLVLYELLTGQPAFAQRDPNVDVAAQRPVAASTIVADVDATLERLILQGLDPDPSQRPASAIAFSAALPGGDVLKASLEAGQTPSPELVASAGASGALSLWIGLALVGAALVSLAIIVATAETRLINQVPLSDPPAVLAARARDLLEEVTGEPQAAHSMFNLLGHQPYLRYIGDHLDTPVDATRIAQLVYRESDEDLIPGFVAGAPVFRLSLDNPPLTAPGMKAVVLDPLGRLRTFRVVPRESPAPADRAVNWTPLIRDSGVDPGSMTPVAPQGPVPPYAEHRVAWSGRMLSSGEVVHIEAGSVAHRPTSFEVRSIGEQDQEVRLGQGSRVPSILSTLLLLGGLATSVAFARRNVRQGRADVRSAARLAAFLFIARVVAWELGVAFLPFEIEVARLLAVASILLVVSVAQASLYLAFEPLVRRRWPSSLISWSRLLAGGIRDPRVGRDVLIGAAASVAGTALYQILLATAPELHGDRDPAGDFSTYLGMRHVIGGGIFEVTNALESSMLLVLAYSVIVMLVRRDWLATLVLLTALLVPTFLGGEASPLGLAVEAIGLTLLLIVFVRFGLVALTAYFVFENLVSSLPLSFVNDWRSEFAMATLVVTGTLLALAAYTAMRPVAGNRWRVSSDL